MMLMMMLMMIIIIDTRPGVKWAICQKWNIYLHWLAVLPPAVDVVYHLWPSCVPVWVEVEGAMPKPGRHIDTIAIRSSRATDLYLWLACMTMSFMLAKVSGWMFIDLILLHHPTLFLSLPEWQHHHHNVHITTSTGGQRLFLDVCMWVCDVHSGTVTSVIMLFRHSYIVGE